MEDTRRIYLEACRELAARFEPDGFRFLSSKRICRRAAPHSIDTIRFESSQRNRAGAFIAFDIWVHASPTGSGITAGGRFGDLAGWQSIPNLAQAPRTRVIDDVESALRANALPWFDLMDDRKRLLGALRADRVWGVHPFAPVPKLMLWLGDRSGAEAALERFISERDLTYRRELLWWIESMRREGVPPGLLDGPRATARLIVENALEVSFPPRTTPAPPRNRVSTIRSSRADLVRDLWRYGEEDAARRAAAASRDELERIWEIARERVGTQSYAKTIAEAAIEQLEESPRPLARQRRRPLQESAIPPMPSDSELIVFPEDR